MKKIYIFALLVLLTLSLFAQKPSGASDGTPVPSPRANEFICAPDAVFSQTHPTYNQAWFGDASSYVTRTGDDYIASGPFSTMRFWGANFWGCAVANEYTFTIRFYERNLIDPLIPGDMVLSFTLPVTPMQIGINSWLDSPVFQVDIDFGTTIDLLDGWVSVTRENVTDGCYFGLLCDEGFGNSVQYLEGLGWVQTYSDNFFCLGGSATLNPRCEGLVSLVGEFNFWGAFGDPDFALTQDPDNPELWFGTLTMSNAMNWYDDPDPNIIECKFRLNADWPVNWGAPDFPSGFGYQDGPNILIPVNADGSGTTYFITFNCSTGEFNFEAINPIPVSNRALYLVIILIAAFLVLRFVKLF